LVVLAMGAVAAVAQTNNAGDSSTAITQACMTSSAWGGQRANRTTYCACSAGFLAGRMTAREFYITGRAAPHFVANDQAAWQSEAARLMSEEGYTRDEIISASQKMITFSDEVDGVCGGL
jgi:hypothetical protein